MTTIKNVMTAMPEDPNLQVGTLAVMGPGLWHIWMVAAFDALDKYAESQEYEEFLRRFSSLLSYRVAHGVW